MTVAQLIRSDYKKHKRYGGNFVSIVFLTQGFWAVFQYRIFSLELIRTLGTLKFLVWENIALRLTKR